MHLSNVSITRDWLVKSRGWLGIAILLPFGCAVALSDPTVKEGSWGDFHLDSLAWIVFIVGAWFRWWATLYIGNRKTRLLATDGPYSLCRNPLYVGTFCMTLSIALFLESLTFGIGLLIATAIYLSITVPAEERRLAQVFGSAYKEYCQSVPRFLPRFDLFRTPATIQVSTRGLMAELFRTARWIWIPILCELVNSLRAESWWPHPFFIP